MGARAAKKTSGAVKGAKKALTGGSNDDVRSELLQALLSRVKEDPFPSGTMLDTIEEMLTPDDVSRYARVLMDKVADERFPSYTMIRRIRDLLA